MTDRDKKLYQNQKMDRANATINEISNLVQFGYYNNAINRLYYACFYAIHALLSMNDVFPKSHKGVLQMFALHFIKTEKISGGMGEFYAKLFQERLLADYADETTYTKEYVQNLLQSAKQLIGKIEVMLSEK